MGGKKICKHDYHFGHWPTSSSFFKHSISDTESVSIMRHKGSHSCGLEPWAHVILGAQLRGNLYTWWWKQIQFLTQYAWKNPRWWTALKISHIYCNISLSETFTDREKPLHIFLDVTELPCHFSDSNLIFTKFTCNCANKQPYIVTDILSSCKDCKISELSCPNTKWKTNNTYNSRVLSSQENSVSMH